MSYKEKSSLSVIIPAYNEEGNLQAAVSTVAQILKDHVSEYEILIFNDGSTDQTGKIAEKIALANPKIKVFHNPGNQGLGYSLQKGFGRAQMDYVTWYAGDNPMEAESMKEMYSQVGKADVLNMVVANPEFRPRYRRIISRSFVVILNSLFGLRLHYYNGFAIYRSDLVKSITLPTQGFTFLAEILVLLIKSGYSYIEVPTHHRLRSHGSSKAFSFKNIRDVFYSLLSLIWRIHFKSEKIKPTVKAAVPV